MVAPLGVGLGLGPVVLGAAGVHAEQLLQDAHGAEAEQHGVEEGAQATALGVVEEAAGSAQHESEAVFDRWSWLISTNDRLLF